ncbi:RNA-binding protein MEX3B [Neodiprion pinetum]|uniref:RNA-binding protein MEX3B n=1 Tax=Neodiprion lecontei TaxID=441921 RepID=A0A6J0BBF3_NEOLC|nr:RNA-binding protein MEX3B [Neodiprion lecontei]XP_046431148.1 RNA-binding protein MEX3B [Neodiprion fabricii]XP_046488004.1 RNA-binding protein MEX3B [Neodiprion pinetum]XP_046624201.1 RNA-binding protein MEX3B [Neodiprion virginianus]
MPTSLFSEMDRGTTTGSLEEQRALQLAFELSMLGLEGSPGNNGSNGDDNLATPASVFEEARSKKSQNMTECVPVPSSEHVAEIVGRQGCKIKALRAKTNTYIKTPVRGEEPVFVVTGRKEDVARAKREILSAAEHFSQIRASRKSSLGALLGAPPGPPASVPGHVTIQVRVPYRVVGLVVGPKGATIKRIQHQTHTYIVTPSRDKEPVFEVTGLPESVEAARREIEAHIALRTGSGPGLEEADLLGALCLGGLGSILGCLDPPGSNGSNGSSGAFSSSGSCSSSSSSSGAPGLNDLVAIWGAGLERDEGLGESPSFESQAAASSIWSFPGVALPSRPSPPASASPASPTDSLLGGGIGRRECVVCGDKEVTAALVPCGHNLFCLDCGNRVCESPNPCCPVCSRPVLQALRILS